MNDINYFFYSTRCAFVLCALYNFIIMIQTIFCSILNTIFASTLGLYPGLPAGPGHWSVVEAGTCAVQYPSNFYFSRQTLNSTADVYSGYFSLASGIDKTFSIIYEFSKLDAGVPNQRVLVESYAQFMTKYTTDTTLGHCHESSRIYPIKFPVPSGLHQFSDYIYKYEDDHLPTIAVYGTYRVHGYLVHGKERVGCLQLTIRFQ